MVDTAVELAGRIATYHLVNVVMPMAFLPRTPVDIVSTVPYGGLEPVDVLGAATDAAAHYLEQLADRMRRDGLRVTKHVEIHTSPAEVILSYTAKLAAPLIAMASHGRGRAGRFFLGSVTDKVLRGGTAPVLVRVPEMPSQGPAMRTEREAASVRY
jgi:nucleotide-binding universal stress UspA family protein